VTAAVSPPAPSQERTGVLAGGNFIIDHVKMIDAFPEQDMLVNISGQTRSNGGGPYNLLKDLRKMGATFPLAATGLLGEDADGSWIRNDCERDGIDTRGLHVTRDAATSYTDAMTVLGTGRRTFFHHRGTNALLAPKHFDFTGSSERIFYLGYLMLLDTLDAIDASGRTGASLALERASSAGLMTAVDLVSVAHPDFRASVLPSLAHTDVLFTNEIEAAMLLGREVPPTPSGHAEAADEILRLGVRRAVVLHSETHAVAASRDGEGVVQPSLDLPPARIVGATGAGDAFAAGCLYALHEGSDLAVALEHGVCAAASSLGSADPSSGVLPVDGCLALAEAFPYRTLAP
jgi:sugar/nucleoside kinase (ribokinase family)